jgi:TonB family protein
VRIVLVAVLILAGGCSAREGHPYEDRTPVSATTDEAAGRRCVLLTSPGIPSSLDAATRPGTRWAVAQWADAAAFADTLDLSIRYGPEGLLDWVRAVRGDGPAPRSLELERILEAGLAEHGTPEWGFRIRLVGGEASIRPSVVCPPARRPAVLGRRPPPVGTDVELAEARAAVNRPIELAVSLNEGGDVVDVRITRSSGSRLMDREAIDRAVWIRYLPRTHDEVGVPSVLQVAFRVLPVRRRGPRGQTVMPEVVG